MLTHTESAVRVCSTDIGEILVSDDRCEHYAYMYTYTNTHTHTHNDIHRYTTMHTLYCTEIGEREARCGACRASCCCCCCTRGYIHRHTHRHTPINTDIYTDMCTEIHAMLHGRWRASAARDQLFCCCTRALCANTELCYAKALALLCESFLARVGAML